MRPIVITALALVASLSQALPTESTAVAKDKDKAKSTFKEAYAGCKCYCLYDCNKFCKEEAGNNPIGFAICFRPCSTSCACTVGDAHGLCKKLEDKEQKPWEFDTGTPFTYEKFPTADTKDPEMLKTMKEIEESNKPYHYLPGERKPASTSYYIPNPTHI